MPFNEIEKWIQEFMLFWAKMKEKFHVGDENCTSDQIIEEREALVIFKSLGATLVVNRSKPE